MEPHPVIVAGFGFRAGASVDALRDAYDRACHAAAVKQADLLATPADKAAQPAFGAMAKGLSLPVVPISDAALQTQTTQTQSAAAQAARATGSVAEAAALAALGRGARLLAPRAISSDRTATCAIATGPKT